MDAIANAPDESNPLEGGENNSAPGGEKRRRRTRKNGPVDDISRLERKRLSDRRSQQAMRQKTKQRIAELESALQALLATNVNRELKEKIAENQALKEEVARLRLRLDRIGRLCFDEPSPASQDRCREATEDPKSPKTNRGSAECRSGSTVDRNNKRRKLSEDASSDELSLPSDQLALPNDSPSISQIATYETGDVSEELSVPHSDEKTPLESDIQETEPLESQDMWPSMEMGFSFDSFSATNPELLHDQAQTLDNLFGVEHNDRMISEAQILSDPPQTPQNTQKPISHSPSYRSLLDQFDPKPSEPTAPGLRNQRSPSIMLPAKPLSSERADSLLQSMWSAEILSYIPRDLLCGCMSFERWVQNTVERYRNLPKATLDDLLPSEPCIGPLFSSASCSKPLSKALFDIMRMGAPWMELMSFMGTYWCLHALLRYFLRPMQEELVHIPQYMWPIDRQNSTQPLSWMNFLPWPNLRANLLEHTMSSQDPELDRFFATSSDFYWPYGVSEAITFNEGPDLQELLSGDFCYPTAAVESSKSRSGCHCSAPKVTERFKIQLMRLQNWRLKRGPAQIVKRYPEITTVML
ncbi:hypothetical protein K432DRAFT_444782 [Lepidopterella palustris CBS 459.81]|uniref:BZIP transcription factor n=1 Tax=Lepidopterella palustris CBS 459.81 TaxID=1314670 RepID=A0A8E2JDC2_9PEZI|nr:hypothetical protein K432DRAFT_444782 [Lepidopterella palustris CBS 459.81]